MDQYTYQLSMKLLYCINGPERSDVEDKYCRELVKSNHDDWFAYNAASQPLGVTVYMTAVCV